MFEKRAHFILALLIIIMPILAGGFYAKLLLDKLKTKQTVTEKLVSHRIASDQNIFLGAFDSYDEKRGFFSGSVPIQGTYSLGDPTELAASTLSFVPDRSQTWKLPFVSANADLDFSSESQRDQFFFGNNAEALNLLGLSDAREGECVSGDAVIEITRFTPCLVVGECGATATISKVVSKGKFQKFTCPQQIPVLAARNAAPASDFKWIPLVQTAAFSDILKNGGIGDSFKHASTDGNYLGGIGVDAEILTTGTATEPPKVDIVVSFLFGEGEGAQARLHVPDLAYSWRAAQSPEFDAWIAEDSYGRNGNLLIELSVPTGEFIANDYIYRCSPSEKTCVQLLDGIITGGN